MVDSGTAGKTLGALLDRVLAGEVIGITRRGKVVALLSGPGALVSTLSFPPDPKPESAAEAAPLDSREKARREQAARDEILRNLGGKKR